MQSLLLGAMLFLVPLGGILGDRLGRQKMLIIIWSIMLILICPFFYLLNSHNLVYIFLALSIATLFSALDQGSNLAAFVENCPISIRYRGLGFAYNLGNAIFGGTDTIIISLLVTNLGRYAPAYYLSI